MTRLFLSIGTALLLTAGTVWAGPLEDATAANKRGDYATALKTFQSLAAQGNAEAQTNLGMEELKVLGTICHISYLTHPQEIVDDLEAALEQFRLIANDLGSEPPEKMA